MKKYKKLLPLCGIAAVSAAIAPLSLTCCNKVQVFHMNRWEPHQKLFDPETLTLSNATKKYLSQPNFNELIFKDFVYGSKTWGSLMGISAAQKVGDLYVYNFKIVNKKDNYFVLSCKFSLDIICEEMSTIQGRVENITEEHYHYDFEFNKVPIVSIKVGLNSFGWVVPTKEDPEGSFYDLIDIQKITTMTDEDWFISCGCTIGYTHTHKENGVISRQEEETIKDSTQVANKNTEGYVGAIRESFGRLQGLWCHSAENWCIKE